jgi:hypothetical protein
MISDTTYATQKKLYLMMYFLLRFLSMCDIFMFVELSNNTFSFFINNVFQCCKFILEYFCSHGRVARARILVILKNLYYTRLCDMM